MGLVLATTGLVFAAGSVGLVRNLACIRLDEDWVPEPAAAQFVEVNRLQGRMLTWFDWGEYTIWHFAPAIKVSFDGRRENPYSEAIRRRHLLFYFDGPAGRDLAGALEPDYIWLRADLPIVNILPQQGWAPIFRGSRSVIFARSRDTHLRQPPATLLGARCFPGP